MIYATQLIHVREGEWASFSEFEATLDMLLARHNGTFILRLRPDPLTTINSSIGIPYEVHLLRFDSTDSFDNFTQDDERKRLLLLHDRSIRSVILIKGQIVAPIARQSTIL